MLAERKGEEKANVRSIRLCGNHVDVGRHEQKRDNRVHPPTSAMVHPAVLHRRPRASAAARGLKSRRYVGRSRQDTRRQTCPRAYAHQDELVTVIEGTWYLGEGTKFNLTNLKGYPAGSFIVIPAGVPHFVAAKEGTVIVQLNGNGKFQTDYVEK